MIPTISKQLKSVTVKGQFFYYATWSWHCNLSSLTKLRKKQSALLTRTPAITVLMFAANLKTARPFLCFGFHYELSPCSVKELLEA